MDRLPRHFGTPSRDLDMQIGTSSAVLTHRFVEESLRRGEQQDDGLDVGRGVINAFLAGILFWIVTGLLLFGVF